MQLPHKGHVLRITVLLLISTLFLLGCSEAVLSNSTYKSFYRLSTVQLPNIDEPGNRANDVILHNGKIYVSGSHSLGGMNFHRLTCINSDGCAEWSEVFSLTNSLSTSALCIYDDRIVVSLIDGGQHPDDIVETILLQYDYSGNLLNSGEIISSQERFYTLNIVSGDEGILVCPTHNFSSPSFFFIEPDNDGNKVTSLEFDQYLNSNTSYILWDIRYNAFDHSFDILLGNEHGTDGTEFWWFSYCNKAVLIRYYPSTGQIHSNEYSIDECQRMWLSEENTGDRSMIALKFREPWNHTNTGNVLTHFLYTLNDDGSVIGIEELLPRAHELTNIENRNIASLHWHPMYSHIILDDSYLTDTKHIYTISIQNIDEPSEVLENHLYAERLDSLAFYTETPLRLLYAFQQAFSKGRYWEMFAYTAQADIEDFCGLLDRFVDPAVGISFLDYYNQNTPIQMENFTEYYVLPSGLSLKQYKGYFVDAHTETWGISGVNRLSYSDQTFHTDSCVTIQETILLRDTSFVTTYKLIYENDGWRITGCEQFIQYIELLTYCAAHQYHPWSTSY